MLIDALSLEEGTSIETQICIIGGGVAGITLAKELAGSFRHIVLLESGDEIYRQEKQNLYAPESVHELYPNPAFSRLRILGGSSNHWENSTNPLDPIDFEKRSWVSGSGWPISFADVAKYYSKAEDYCSVGRDGYDLNHWLKILNTRDPFSSSSIFETSITKLATPPTRFFVKYRDELTSNESLHIYKNATFTDVEFDGESRDVKTVSFCSRPGIKHSVTAKSFVMCLGGIENARMLLEINERNSNSLGNRFDNVGRYFMDHPVVRAANLYPTDNRSFGLYDHALQGNRLIRGDIKLRESALNDNEVNNARITLVKASNYILSSGISSVHVLRDSLRKTESPDQFGTHLMNIIKDIDLVAEAVTRDVFDKTLFDSAKSFGGYQLLAMIEQTPEPGNRISLGEERDEYGIRRTNISWKVSEDDKIGTWKVLEFLAKEVGILSIGRIRVLRERESRIWESQLGFGHHHMGTTRMASSDKHGVVDDNQKIFGTKNFFVGGSSVFATGGHVPPTLTIVALSIRLARYISQRYGS